MATAYSATASKYTLQITPTTPTLSGITATHISASTTGPVNLSAGSSGVIFARNGVDLAKVQALTVNDTGLTPNALYSYAARGSNAEGVETAASLVSGRRSTLAKAGIATDGLGNNGNLWCTNASVNTWYGIGKTFVFGNPAGFGTSTHGGSPWKASAFEYKWNATATESWTTGGTVWASGTLELTPVE